MEEKRKLERFHLEVPAKIEPVLSNLPKKEKSAINLLTSNICSGGAFFNTDQPLPEGTEVKIDILLPLDRLKELIENCHEKACIRVTGKVVRLESEGMAICFDEDYEIEPADSGSMTTH